MTYLDFEDDIKALDQRRNINHQDYLNINKGLI